ncbi:MAG: hypothetical protein WC091_02510 [Sulfuricellaceae bacterium]
MEKLGKTCDCAATSTPQATPENVAGAIPTDDEWQLAGEEEKRRTFADAIKYKWIHVLRYNNGSPNGADIKDFGTETFAAMPIGVIETLRVAASRYIQATSQQPDTKAVEGLVLAADAVIQRWDTPNWKDAPATADFINQLREALAKFKAGG